jgi:hypothetical protein
LLIFRKIFREEVAGRSENRGVVSDSAQTSSVAKSTLDWGDA